jgi:hypothetical protein
LVRKLQRAGLEVQLQNLTSGTGIATIGWPRECQLRGRSASGKFGDPDDRSLYSVVRKQLFRDHDDVPTS